MFGLQIIDLESEKHLSHIIKPTAANNDSCITSGFQYQSQPAAPDLTVFQQGTNLQHKGSTAEKNV